MSGPAWLERHLTAACTIYRRVDSGLRDEYNAVIYVEEPVASRCYIQPASQEEIQAGRAMVGQYLVHFPAEAATQLDGFSRVMVHGISYEAVGPPAVFPSLTAPGVHHVECTVEKGTA